MDRLIAKFLTLEKFVYSLLLLTAALIIRRFIKKALNIFSKRIEEKAPTKKMTAKTKTLKSLLQNIADITIVIITLLMILSSWGIDITPILTGAGILGLAVSFGSQSLVKDLIAGFFILWEDQFNVGDTVEITNFKGEVEKITLRTTILKDAEGKKIFIPNSQIKAVARYPKSR